MRIAYISDTNPSDIDNWTGTPGLSGNPIYFCIFAT